MASRILAVNECCPSTGNPVVETNGDGSRAPLPSAPGKWFLRRTTSGMDSENSSTVKAKENMEDHPGGDRGDISIVPSNAFEPNSGFNSQDETTARRSQGMTFGHQGFHGPPPHRQQRI
ncbi:predicted protein [Histoplasma capsulatum var. duboisii H88]|uniref:Predicted protein n=2 Tax=Ajellomyces capsulatus TaxID=5037 RepID=F0UC75_AJEC8|nr:predicted protein [Histoplasma capsulatum H143]EGC43175.1 predicted protein [Histoplasma capsulatum var. duboisii H88]